MDSQIDILIVDDSTALRGLLIRILENEKDFKIVGSVSNGQLAIDFIKKKPVHVVILDVEMPVMDGITALPKILEVCPTTHILMFSALTEKGADVTLKALKLGATDFITKPSTQFKSLGVQEVSKILIEKCRTLGNVKKRDVHLTLRSMSQSFDVKPVTQADKLFSPEVLLIGSSTGGPNALELFLTYLGTSFPLPILIVQHMPPLFTQMLAERLSKCTGKTAIEVTKTTRIENGNIYIAPGDFHMQVIKAPDQHLLTLNQEDRINFCRPAVDPLFQSAEKAYQQVIAVILTGMGEDGKRGVSCLKNIKSKVYVQDEATSVVWGMPGAVANAGLADGVFNLKQMAEKVLGHIP